MKYCKIFTGLSICLLSFGALAQTNVIPAEKNRKFTLYAGVGPNIYFNNLVLAKNYVHEQNYSFAGRLMWEPEHFLSLGIESGYYCLYKIDFGELSDIKISNYAVPIQLVICMKFLKTFYFNFGTGQTILLNKVSVPNGEDINASTLSLGDLSGSLGYRHRLNEHFSISAETKFFFASKLDDKNMALLFLLGYSF